MLKERTKGKLVFLPIRSFGEREAARYRRRSGRGGEKALIELLFEELICAPERLGFSIPNKTYYMMFLIPYCSSVYVEAKSVFPEGTQKW